MSDEEELDKETIGRKVRQQICWRFFLLQNILFNFFFISPHMLVMLLILEKFGIYVQAAETLPDQTLQEYKDIFSFFDR